MLDSIIKITFSILVLVGLNSCVDNEYVEYKPLVLSENNEQKVYGKAELDSIEFQNTIQVLEYYNESYRTKNGNVILIPEQLSKDWETIYGITPLKREIRIG